MADKFVLYTAENTDSYGIPVDEDLLGLYNDVTGEVAPTEFDDLAALIVAHATATAKPAGVQVATARVGIAGFTSSAALPLLNAAARAAVALKVKGATPFPIAPIAEGDANLNISGFTGESRLSN